MPQKHRSRFLNLGLSIVGAVFLEFGCGGGGGSALVQNAPPGSGGGTPKPASIPKHVMVWAYDDTGVGGLGATAAQVQAFTNFDEETTDNPPGKAERDCYPGAGPVTCQAIWYIRGPLLYTLATPDQYFLKQLNSENLPNDAGFYHNASRVTSDRVSNTGTAVDNCELIRFGPCLFPNLSNPNVTNFIVNCLVQGGPAISCGGHAFRGPAPGTELFEDNMPALCENVNNIGIYFFGGSTTFTPVELGSEPGCDANLHSNTLTYLASLKYANGTQARAWLNGYAPLCGKKTCAYPSDDVTYWTRAAVPALGVIDEGTVCTSTTTPSSGFIGAVVLDDIAELFNEAGRGDFVLLNYSSAPAGSANQLQMRRYCDGIFWLGFDVNRSVLWSNYNNGNRSAANAGILAAYPEEQIVPMKPVETMSDVNAATFGYNGTGCNAGLQFDATMRGGVQSLVVACGLDNTANVAGVYVREFGQCYSWGSLIGAGQCAVVVNMTNAPTIIGGSSTAPWKYPSGAIALSQSYNEMLVLSGNDMATDNCSTASGCPVGRATDLDFGGSFTLYSTTVAPGDAAYLFHS